MWTTYRIHDLLTVHTNTSLPIPSYFVTEADLPPPELSVHETTEFDSTPPSYARRLASHHYWFDDGTLTVSYPSTPAGNPVAVQISDLHRTETTLRYTPAFRQSVDFGELFEGILTVKLIDADVALVHAGALADGDRATLLTSMGRMGKTSTILSILSTTDDVGFLGDNIILVDPDGWAYAWPATVGVFPGTAVSDEYLPSSERLRVKCKRILANSDLLVALLLHKFSRDLSESIEPTEFARIMPQASIERIFVLNGGRLPTSDRNLSTSDLSAKVATGTDMELDPQNYYLSLYAFAGDAQSVHPTQIKRRREDLIKQAFAEVERCELFASDVSGYADRIDL